jgi:hypothetical protein
VSRRAGRSNLISHDPAKIPAAGATKKREFFYRTVPTRFEDPSKEAKATATDADDLLGQE